MQVDTQDGKEDRTSEEKKAARTWNQRVEFTRQRLITEDDEQMGNPSRSSSTMRSKEGAKVKSGDRAEPKEPEPKRNKTGQAEHYEKDPKKAKLTCLNVTNGAWQQARSEMDIVNVFIKEGPLCIVIGDSQAQLFGKR